MVAAEQVLAAGRRFVRNDEERSVLCVGRAELAWSCGDRDALTSALAELATCSRRVFGLNAFAESAAIHSLLRDDVSGRHPQLPDVTHAGRRRGPHRAIGVRVLARGDSGTAIRAFGDAAATWAERGFHRFAARCSFAAGELARRGGDERAARRHLCAAAEVATRWRLAPIIAATPTVPPPGSPLTA